MDVDLPGPRWPSGRAGRRARHGLHRGRLMDAEWTQPCVTTRTTGRRPGRCRGGCASSRRSEWRSGAHGSTAVDWESGPAGLATGGIGAWRRLWEQRSRDRRRRAGTPRIFLGGPAHGAATVAWTRPEQVVVRRRDQKLSGARPGSTPPRRCGGTTWPSTRAVTRCCPGSRGAPGAPSAVVHRAGEGWPKPQTREVRRIASSWVNTLVDAAWARELVGQIRPVDEVARRDRKGIVWTARKANSTWAAAEALQQRPGRGRDQPGERSRGTT